METLDLIVIGAGPAGLSAAVEARRGGLAKILVFEKGASHSEMIRTFYKEGKRVDARYAGQEALCFGLLCLKDGNRETYLGLMDHVIAEHDLKILYKTEVWSIRRRDEGGFEVRTSGGNFAARTVVIAIGRMGKPNQPDYYRDIPMSLKSSGRILFDITSQSLEGQRLLVVGGGDSASEYCDILSGSNAVTLSYRRAEFSRMNSINRGILEGLIARGKIRAHLSSNIVAIEDHEGGARVRYAEPGLPVETYDAVVYALGGMSPASFLQSAGVAVGERGEPVVAENHETSAPGLYVVGDLLGKGKGGGSIIAGFNSASEATRDLLQKYFSRHVEAQVVTLDHMKF